MKPLVISDAAHVTLVLQDEIRRSEDARYDHRLHGVLLIAQGVSCPQVAALLGDSARTVEYWVRRFESKGLAGLAEGDRPGRPSRLMPEQLEQIDRVLRGTPREVDLGVTLWDGKTLSEWIEREYGVELGVRQCQRLFRQRGFRLRKPRPAIAGADPKLQKAHKKTPIIDEKRGSGPVGTRRSAFSAARFTVPDVDTAGNQGPCSAPPSYPQERRILWSGSPARRKADLPPGDRPFQRRIFPGIPEGAVGSAPHR